nr:bifunctional 2',3'-cyclic-nucleotide 2'-phosphodiesterase/3'-nucleotidase [uncultured Celeribacter sp.]
MADPAQTSQHPFSTLATEGQVHLRILETTDLHMHVFPYDYFADKPMDSAGLARTATLMERARQEAANCLLLDNGDFLQGNPMGDFMAHEKELGPGELHPMIAAMNTLGYDASTLGNHEFNYGIPYLMTTIAGADFPIVSANIVKTEGATPVEDDTLVPPYVILERSLTDGAGEAQTIKIGLIGLAPPQIMMWDHKNVAGQISLRDIVDTARAYVPEIRAQGADIVIALCHTGIGPGTHTEGMENAAVPLAAIEGIDALLTGHTHLLFPSPMFYGLPDIDAQAGLIHGKPAMMPGYWGSHLGVMDLLLEQQDGVWRIRDSETALRPIATRNPDLSLSPTVESAPAVIAATERAHFDTLDYVRRPVGRTETPLHSYFALLTDDPSVQLVANAQIAYTTEMMKGTAHEGLPVLSCTAPFKAGGRNGPDYYTDIPAGDLAIKHVADLYLYSNTVRALRINGDQLKGWLERSAGQFNQIAPGSQDAALLHPVFPAYNFDVIDGVTYQIDISQPARFDHVGTVLDPTASRIVNLQHEGRPVTPEMEFIICTNNYRAYGGGSFPGADGSTVVFEGPDANRDIVVRYILEQGTINPKADNNWSLAPMPGTTVVYHTGPGARTHLSALEGRTVTDLGDNAEGFATLRVTL